MVRNNFKYSIGQAVWQRFGDDGWDCVLITDRTVINGHNVYTTDMWDRWVHEDNLKLN